MKYIYLYYLFYNQIIFSTIKIKYGINENNYTLYSRQIDQEYINFHFINLLIVNDALPQTSKYNFNDLLIKYASQITMVKVKLNQKSKNKIINDEPPKIIIIIIIINEKFYIFNIEEHFPIIQINEYMTNLHKENEEESKDENQYIDKSYIAEESSNILDKAYIAEESYISTKFLEKSKDKKKYIEISYILEEESYILEEESL
jgi:hypothetical protein